MHVESNELYDLQISRRRPIVRSYIAILPTELLVPIFAYASYASNDIEFKLALVCRRWRHIVLHTPSIWTKLRISESTSIDKARIYIQRSENMPLYLDVDITSRNCYTYADGRHGLVQYSKRQEIVELLLSCTDRWKHLSLTVWDDCADYTNPSAGGVASVILTNFVDIYVPLLENFKLSAYSRSSLSSVFFQPPIRFFQRGAPMLTHFGLCEVGPDICSVPSATSTLTFLSVETSQLKQQLCGCDLWDYLRGLPALTHLNLKDDFYNNDIPLGNILQLPHLVSLRLEPGAACPVNKIGEVLASISAPHLEHISLTPLPDFLDPYTLCTDEEAELLPNFLARFVSDPPFPSLQSLILHFPAIPLKVTNFFHAFPTISYVSLADMNSKEMIKEMLKGHICKDSSSNPPLLWPNLQTLVLENWNVSDEIELLLKLLYVRERAGSPIKQLKLRNSEANTFKAISPWLRSKLDELVSVELETDLPPWLI